MLEVLGLVQILGLLELLGLLKVLASTLVRGRGSWC